MRILSQTKSPKVANPPILPELQNKKSIHSHHQHQCKCAIDLYNPFWVLTNLANCCVDVSSKTNNAFSYSFPWGLHGDIIFCWLCGNNKWVNNTWVYSESACKAQKHRGISTHGAVLCWCKLRAEFIYLQGKRNIFCRNSRCNKFLFFLSFQKSLCAVRE